jgi:hypothetical protein
VAMTPPPPAPFTSSSFLPLQQLELTKPLAILQRTFTYFFTNSLRFSAPCSSFKSAFVAVRDKMCCDIVCVPVLDGPRGPSLSFTCLPLRVL